MSSLPDFTIPSEITVRCLDLKYQEGGAMRWLFHLKMTERWRTHLKFFNKVTEQSSYATVELPAHLAATPARAWHQVQGKIKAGSWLTKPSENP